MKQIITVKINSEATELAVESHRSLLEVLRLEAAMTGTKEGCDVGECGSCTVIMNGKPVNSCLVLAVEADGAEVFTIEGVQLSADKPHPLQENFMKCGAAQCGFCTPRDHCRGEGVARREPDADDRRDPLCTGGQHLPLHRLHEDHRSRRSHGTRVAMGNAGGCGMNARSFEALDVPGAESVGAHRSVIGTSVKRSDLLGKVTGDAKYVADIHLPGLLHGKTLRSKIAHARIVGIDTSRALSLPGVKAVLTHKNVPRVLHAGSPHPRSASVTCDQYILDDKVRYWGEGVAVVAAITEEIAEEALALIDVPVRRDCLRCSPSKMR